MELPMKVNDRLNYQDNSSDIGYIKKYPAGGIMGSGLAS